MIMWRYEVTQVTYAIVIYSTEIVHTRITRGWVSSVFGRNLMALRPKHVMIFGMGGSGPVTKQPYIYSSP